MARRAAAIKKEITVDSVYGDPLISILINKVMKRGKKTVAERIVYGSLVSLYLQVRRTAKDASGKAKSEKMSEYFSGLEGGSAKLKTLVPEGIAKQDVLDCFYQAVKHAKPDVELKPRRVGGATYQVPVEVNSSRGDSLSLRWLLEAATNGSEKGMVSCLARALLDAYNNQGAAVNKKNTVIKMAQANAAFAHFRW